jgi:hypothetical protein
MTGVHIKDDSIDTTHGCILYLEEITVSFDGFKLLGKHARIMAPFFLGKTTTSLK